MKLGFNLENVLNTLLLWFASNGIRILIDLILLWIAFKLINIVTKKFIAIMHKRNVDKSLVLFLESFLEISLKIIVVIVFLEFIGIGATTLAALVASAGLAVGLSLKGSLSNFAGGIIILLLRPFKVGDTITYSSNTGKVERIHIFYTEIVTGDNKEIYIPNGSLTTGVVINSSVKNTRRVDLTFTVADEKNLLKAKNLLLDIIKENENIISNPEPLVAVNTQGGSGIGFVVRVWCNRADYNNVYYALMENVNIKFEEEGLNES